MAFYKWAWVKKDAFLQGLGDLLKPAILAEGYDLHAEDVGKQVYVRGQRAITQKARFHMFNVPVEEVRNAMRLTVGYVLTPTETRVRFQWENPYYAGYWAARQYLDHLALNEARRFQQYLEDWYKAARGCENKDEALPGEGSNGAADGS